VLFVTEYSLQLAHNAGGVSDGVMLGVILGVTLGVSDGVILGVSDGVTLGVIDGVIDGVKLGLIEILGVGDGVGQTLLSSICPAFTLQQIPELSTYNPSGA
jgi:hypothetical protein